MDKLSELLQEAKPLYKQRKRVKRNLIVLFLLVVPTISFTGIMNLYNSGNEVYLSLNDNSLQNELLLDSMNLLR